jgi:NAD(P)H-nitrite reductase large subunit
MTRYVIVGSGVAGIGAIDGIRSMDEHGEIVLICEEKEGYYSRPGLAYYLTGELPESQLFPHKHRNYKQEKIDRVHARAIRLSFAERLVELSNGQRIPYESLLIATGSRASRIKIPGISGDGVLKLDNIEDARRITRCAREIHRAAVVGGGITALEIVEGLLSRKVKVDYILRGERYWSNVLDEPESRRIEHRLREEGVQIYFNTEVAEVLEKKGRMVGLRTKEGLQIPGEALFAAVGVQPRKELAESSGLKMDRGILVNENLQTSQPDVFAAGDVAQVFDPLTGGYVLDTLWGPAREQGIIAGKNMAAGLVDKPFTTYAKPVPFNVTRLAGLTTTIIGLVGSGEDHDLVGIARGDSEVWRRLPDAIACQAGFDVNRIRLLLGEKTILGAVVMGDQTLSRPIQQLVSTQVDISSICADLLYPDAPVSDIIAGFWARYHEKGGGT